MDSSMPGLPVHHQLPKLTQTHIHWVGDAIEPSHLLLSPSPPAFHLSQHQGHFKWVILHIRWKSIGRWASASVQFISDLSLSWVWLCNPMNSSTPGLPVHHQLLEFTQPMFIESVMPQPSHPLSSPSPPAPIFPSIRVFSNESALCIRRPKYWSAKLFYASSKWSKF